MSVVDHVDLVIQKVAHGMGKIVKASSIAIKGKMVKYIGMVEKDLLED